MSLFDLVVDDRHRRELLAMGARAQGTISGVRYDDRAVVVEATPGAQDALGQRSDATWITPPGPPTRS